MSPFTIFDIAHALSLLCRFTGHCSVFYSVAQHSVSVSNMVPPEHGLAGLLHDAAEAFIGDVAKPLKMMLPDYQRIEARIEATVLSRFGLSPVLPRCVKDADYLMLRREQRDLMTDGQKHVAYTPGIEPWQEAIVPLAPDYARRLFMDRYIALTGGLS